MVAPAKHPTLALIDELLEDQQRLQTPVARYSQHHDTAPALEPLYRDLIPLSTPAPGEQYAFEVDLDSCSGCKACVAGCHSLNGLDDNEAWRDVGVMIGGHEGRAVQQTITSACHHCIDPACLHGCPVLAYEKDPITGIVRHLDDQCIGCSYCILKCPYDVPKYSDRLGIVRKCDMCHQRLAAGEAPACVQACPTRAIRIITVPAAGAAVDTSHFLPGAPDPATTRPTTRYRTKRELPGNLVAADVLAPAVQAKHLPLATMLVLTQLAVGLQAAALLDSRPRLALAGYVLALGGIAANVLHLGRPLRAWRIFLGVRRSWLSREALVFGAWLGAATVALLPAMTASLLPVTVALGVLGVFCSAMIYVDTGRSAWRPPTVATRFAGTFFLAGAAAFAPIAGAAVLALKLVAEGVQLRRAPEATRRLALGPCHRWTMSRFWLGTLGAGLLALSGNEPGAVGCALIVALIGEGLERVLFFMTVNPSKMPGTGSA